MNDTFFPIDRLRLFSADGQLYKAFDHVIAARMGTLMLVPLHLVVGPRDAVLDACTVPNEEVFAVLEHPCVNKLPRRSWNGLTTWIDELQQLEYLGIDPSACDMDHIAPMVNGKKKVLRLVHPSGMRYAVVMP